MLFVLFDSLQAIFIIRIGNQNSIGNTKKKKRSIENVIIQATTLIQILKNVLNQMKKRELARLLNV